MTNKLRLIIVSALLGACLGTAAAAQPRTARIYLLRESFFENGRTEFEWSFVKRKIDPEAPLHSAIKSLFELKLTREEQRWAFRATLFTRFRGVRLKNGVATVRFSDLPDMIYGETSARDFSAAIEKTALQFPFVKKVEICAVGPTKLDLLADRKWFPPCAKQTRRRHRL